MDVGAVPVADVHEAFRCVEDDQHLDAQRLVQAGVSVRVVFFGLLVRAHGWVVVVDGVVLVDGDRVAA